MFVNFCNKLRNFRKHFHIFVHLGFLSTADLDVYWVPRHLFPLFGTFSNRPTRGGHTLTHTHTLKKSTFKGERKTRERGEGERKTVVGYNGGLRHPYYDGGTKIGFLVLGKKIQLVGKTWRVPALSLLRPAVGLTSSCLAARTARVACSPERGAGAWTS